MKQIILSFFLNFISYIQQFNQTEVPILYIRGSLNRALVSERLDLRPPLRGQSGFYENGVDRIDNGRNFKGTKVYT